MINTGKSTRGWHRLECFHECPQKFAYSELLGLRPKIKKEELFLGTLVHVALAHRYGEILNMPEAIDPIEAMRKEGNGSFIFHRAKDIYNLYDLKWKVEDFRPIAIEEEFAININGELFTQRIDLVANINGRICFVDHKTYSRKSIWERRGQFLGQTVLGKTLVPEKYGLPFGGIWVNEICTLKPVGSRSFSRRKVEMPNGLVDSFTKEVARSYKEMASLVSLDPYSYPRNYSACEGKYGRGCDYWNICCKGKSVLEEYE
mgnify:CR=1 FL=1